jgi:hypothetical protein
MALHLVFLGLLQQLVVAPSQVEVGQVVRVSVRAEAGTAQAGIAVALVRPDGAEPLGVTDEQGRLTYQPKAAGAQQLTATVAGRPLSAELLVVSARRLLQVSPYTIELGQPIDLFVRSREGESAIRGIPVEAMQPDGSTQRIGTTEDGGHLRFQPTAIGEWVFAIQDGKARVVAPMRVLPARNRWIYGIVCVPLGLVLLVAIARRWRRQSVASSSS